MSPYHLFTSESVSDGHPDKLCDQLSDVLVDLCLQQNPFARTAIEVMATTQRVIVSGEVSGVDWKSLPIEEMVRQHVRLVGYQDAGFSWDKFVLHDYVHAQSDDIAKAVEAADGAGDQGLMFGYACSETEELMPAALAYSHRILKSLKVLRAENSFLSPDAKAQVTLRYEEDRPIGVHKLVLSTQHDVSVSLQELKTCLIPFLLEQFPKEWLKEEDILINPSGRFVIGGPDGDTGLTGRKIIVDTYGGAAPHGGGAFSGKDATKVDRSAAYMARYATKNIVAKGLATKCTLQVSYAIGCSAPMSLYINTHGTGKIPDAELEKVMSQCIDWTPYGIKKALQLERPIFTPTASYGHFGRTPTPEGHFSWEKTDLSFDNADQ